MVFVKLQKPFTGRPAFIWIVWIFFWFLIIDHAHATAVAPDKYNVIIISIDGLGAQIPAHASMLSGRFARTRHIRSAMGTVRPGVLGLKVPPEWNWDGVNRLTLEAPAPPRDIPQRGARR